MTLYFLVVVGRLLLSLARYIENGAFPSFPPHACKDKGYPIWHSASFSRFGTFQTLPAGHFCMIWRRDNAEYPANET